MSTEAAEEFPVYRSTARALADRIRRGDLAPGSRVPSERELAVEYGISRMTARAAMNLLGQRGLIERRGRSGTFVASPKIELDLSSVAGLSARLLRQGITPGARVIEGREIGAGELDAAVAGALEVADNRSVYVVVRTRTGDGEPLALEESYFPVRCCPGLLENELTGSIYELLRDRYGLEPAHLHQEVELTQLDSAAAVKLGTRPDVPVLQVTRTAWASDGRPIEFARDLYRGDRLLFIAETDQVAKKRKGPGRSEGKDARRNSDSGVIGVVLGTSDPALERVVDEMPGWRSAGGVRAEYISGGITNRNFCVRVDGRPFFVRLAGEETEALGIDRDNERRTVEVASEVGIGPGVVSYLPDHGCLITEWIDGRPVPPEDLRRRDVLARLVRSLKAFHDHDSIPGSFSPFRVVEQYRAFAESRGVEIPGVYWWLLERAGEIERAFQEAPAPLRPCHNDLLNSNFLLRNGHVMIVDYEYAGMGDVFFDLGNLSVNNELDEETDLALIEEYFGEATPVRVARLKLMRLMSDFREAMWGVMQQALSTLDFDYVDYANKHFARCREHAEDDRYSTWLRDSVGQP